MYVLVLLSALLACAAGVPFNSTKPMPDGRIVGGTETDITDHPYQVSLQYIDAHLCGGSIISSTWMVTSARCVSVFLPNSLFVRSGSTSSFLGSIHNITRIIRHENFDFSLNYDVALVQVSPAFTFSDSVQPITLECDPVPVGTDVVLTGWGYNPDTLYQVTLQTTSDFECNSTLSGSMGDHMMCARDSNGVKGGDVPDRGFQYQRLVSLMSVHQTFNELPEAGSVSGVQEQLVPEHEEELVSKVEQSVSQVVKPLVSDTEVQLPSQVEERLMTEVGEPLVSEHNEELVSEVKEQSVSWALNPLVSESEVHLVSESEVQLVSQVEEHVTEIAEPLVFEVSPDIICRVLKSTNRSLLKCKEMIINSTDNLPMNIKEPLSLCTDKGATVHESLTPDKSELTVNTPRAFDMEVEEEETGSKKYKYVCGECEEMFTIKAALSKHKRTHFRMVFECDYCKKQCKSQRHLNDHRRLHTKELPFMCEFCGKCFRTKVYLNKHRFVHKPPSYTCQICNKKCSSSFYLAQHKKGHSADTKLICEVCGKIIYTPFSLKLHMRTHTGEKPFNCATCRKCFISAAKLREHRLIHTDRKFRCVTCGKGYYFKASLRKHQRCHKLREYRCPICFTLFANSDNMRRHGKVYCIHPVCTICGQTLLTDEMVEEQRIRDDEKEEGAVTAKCRTRQYLKCCPVCSQTICGRGNMLKHMKDCHKDYGYKPFACERCVKMFSSVYVLGDDIEYDIVNSD